MCILLMGTRLFQQSMRNLVGLLVVFMVSDADMQITVAEKGSLLSAVAVGYLFTQVPGGALADKVGAKNVITLALGLSALLCIAVPSAASMFGLRGLWCTIALMGAVQGPLFPTSTVFLSRWMPRKTSSGSDEKARKSLA